MNSLHIPLKQNPYSIFFSDGKSGDLIQAIQAAQSGKAGVLEPFSRCVLVTNPKINRLHGKRIRAELETLGEACLLQIPDGEAHKTLATVEKLYAGFLKLKVDRKTPIIALGGGVVGDVVGFAAATYLRGLPFIQIPTTLLAQVDSSVGGKTGVDLAAGKNLVGAFYQPKLVWIDSSMLSTLPKRELLCGSAEVIKYAAIKSPKLFETLEEKIDDFLKLSPDLTQRVVQECVAIKAKIVSEDEKETKGLRAILNFGHTLGHAVETLSGYDRYSHGEAVAIGMVFAANLSVSLGLMSEKTAERLRKLISQAGLPVTLPDYPAKKYLSVMQNDKKMLGGTLQYILLEKVGKTRTEKLTLQTLQNFLEKELDRKKKKAGGKR